MCFFVVIVFLDQVSKSFPLSCFRIFELWAFFTHFDYQAVCLFVLINLFIYFWLRWVFVAARGLSLVVASRGYSSLQCAGFSLQWLLLLRSMGFWHAGFSSCGTWTQQLWRMGLVAPRHVGSSRTRARTRVPCIGRQILNHCATRKVLEDRKFLTFDDIYSIYQFFSFIVCVY